MKKVVFASILIATILAGGVLAYQLWKATPMTAEAFYDSGKSYYDEKKYPEATIQMLNAVRQDPKNLKARKLLVLCYIAQQDLRSAVKQLRAILEYYPNDNEAELQLGNLYLTGGRNDSALFREAQASAEKVLARDKNNVPALILLGNASAGLEDYQESVRWFEQAIDLEPGNLSAFVSLGTIQALQKNFAEAEQAFLKARKVNPKDKTAVISLGNFYRARSSAFQRAGDLQAAISENVKAENTIKEALTLFPTDKDVYLQAFNFYVQMRRMPDAEAVLRNVQSKLTDDPSPSLLLAELLNAQEKPTEVRELLLELKKQHPKSIAVASKLAFNLLPDRPDQARKEIKQISDEDPKNPIGPILLGELQFFSNDFDAAEATLSKVKDSRDPRAHFFLGSLASRKGQADQAVFHYQTALSVNSRHVPARVALAEIFMAQGKVADAREEIRKALEANKDFVPARLIKAMLDSGARNYAEAERELDSLVKEHPGDFSILRQMALYNQSRGKVGDAERNLVRAQELQPDSDVIFRDLVVLYLRSKQTDKAIQKLNTIPDSKKKAFHYELGGLAYLQAGKTVEAEKSFKEAVRLEPSRVSSNSYLFAAYLNEGKLDQGMKTLEEVITQEPKNANAVTAKGILYEKQGKIDEAKKYYNEALKLDPNAVGAANNLAWILAEEGKDLTTALNLAQMARNKAPNNGAIADTLGWVYYKLGSHVQAREQFRFAVSKDPEHPTLQYHLGLAFKETKQFSEARSALGKATASKKEFKERNQAQAALKELANLK
jgi:tetratricopeptide (TPR) repeat protein